MDVVLMFFLVPKDGSIGASRCARSALLLWPIDGCLGTNMRLFFLLLEVGSCAIAAEGRYNTTTSYGGRRSYYSREAAIIVPPLAIRCAGIIAA